MKCHHCSRTARPNRTRCEACAAVQSRANARRRNERRANGVCITCGGVRFADKMRCLACLLQIRDAAAAARQKKNPNRVPRKKHDPLNDLDTVL